MTPLNLPEFNFKLKKEDNRTLIFDKTRKKFIVLTPEEWVRQNYIEFLIQHKNYPRSLFAIEMGIKVVNTKKRVDVAVYNTKRKVETLIECKAPNIKITQNTFDQIARYNMTLDAKYLIVTNGITHYYALIDYKNKRYTFIKDIPLFAL